MSSCHSGFLIKHNHVNKRNDLSGACLSQNLFVCPLFACLLLLLRVGRVLAVNLAAAVVDDRRRRVAQQIRFRQIGVRGALGS